MNNYKQINFNTCLDMRFNEDVSSELGNMLPYPHKHYVNLQTSILGNKNVYTYCYVLDGTFNTRKGIEFINDIVARMMISFPNVEVVKYKYYIEDEEKHKHLTPLKLKHFQNLKSIQSKIVNFEKAQSLNCEDQVFWALKLYFEHMIKNNNLSYEHFLDFAYNNFIDRAKDRSTLRAKCRNIYNYYCSKDFKVFCEYERKMTDEEYLMTRKENMKKQTKARALETKRKVLNLISGMFAAEYKKPNGAWNITKICKESGTSRNSVYKYLQEYNN